MEAVEILVHEDFEDALLERFTSEMEALTEPCVIAIDIKSNGGYIHILEPMVDLIKAKKEAGFVIITNVDEYAYSCGFILFLVGDIKTVAEKAELMYHDAGLEVEDRLTSSDAKEIYEILSKCDEVIDKIVLENTELSLEMFSILKKNTTFFNREDLIYLGIMQNEYSLN